MIGLGVYDALARDIVDIDNGELYPALSCYNNAEMAARCPVMGAEKVIWSIKASAQLNSDMAHLLREAFKSGRIRLLGTEYDAEDILSEVKGYNSLDVSEKGKIMLPYIQTTLLIDELTKLEYEESNGKIRLFEKQGMRKDRYSSLAYNYFVATQLEIKQSKKMNNDSYEESYVIKPPVSCKGKALGGYGRVGTKWR